MTKHQLHAFYIIAGFLLFTFTIIAACIAKDVIVF